MNAIIILLKSSISRVFSRCSILTSKYFHKIAFLNKTLRFGVYDGLKQSNKKSVETQNIASLQNRAKGSFIELNGGGV